MKNLSRLKTRRVLGEINTVPYIDVMLVLLVILMATAPMLTQGVSVNLPQTQASPLPSQEESPVIISIDASGRYYLNTKAQPDQSVSPGELSETLAHRLAAARHENKTIQVWVQGDQVAHYGQVVTLMALLQQMGIQQIGLVTMPTTALNSSLIRDEKLAN